MKLSRRIVLELALFSLLYGLCLASIVSLIARPRFEAIEREEALADLGRIRAFIDQEEEALDANLLGYASWDDTVEYIEKPEPSFIETNYSKAWLATMGVEVLCIADARGRVRYEVSHDPATGEPMELGGFFSAPGGGGRALAAEAGLEPRSGFLLLGGRTLLAASRPIRNSAGDSPSYGRMVFGRFYTGRDEKRISGLMRLDLSFALSASRAGISRSGSSLLATAPFPVLAGEAEGAAGGIVLRHPERILAQGAAMTELLALATFLVGVVFIAAIYLAVKLGVLSPIAALAAAARAIAAREDARERLPADRADEIGDLASSFNGLLDQLHAANANLEARIAERTAELKEANEGLKLMGEVFAHSLEGIIIAGPDREILAVNPAFERISGYSAAEVIGRRPDFLGAGEGLGSSSASLESLLEGRDEWRGELWNRRPDDSPYPVWISISALRGEGGAASRYIAVFHDISDAKRNEERMRRQAFYDALTGLPNRVLLADKIENAIDRSRRFGMKTAVLFLDLDGFKDVNDNHGHEAGDRILKEVAQRLRRIARSEDTVARLGGDEFVILLEDVDNFEVLSKVALRLIAGVSKEVELEEGSVRVSASVGIAIYPEDGADASALIRSADGAMYAAKQAGKATFRFSLSGGADQGAGGSEAEPAARA